MLATADVGSVGTDGAVAVIVTMAAADFVGSATEVTIRYFRYFGGITDQITPMGPGGFEPPTDGL